MKRLVKAEQGITLIELLAVVALMGVIVVPLFTAFGSSYQQTMEQANDTQLLYYAETVLESVKFDPRLVSHDFSAGPYMDQGVCADGHCMSTTSPGQDGPGYVVYVEPYQGEQNLLQIVVEATPAPSSQRTEPVRLVTVVRR